MLERKDSVGWNWHSICIIVLFLQVHVEIVLLRCELDVIDDGETKHALVTGGCVSRCRC